MLTCPTDCSCGDGICDGSENPALCPADCTGGAGGGGGCNNNLVCDSSSGETMLTCPTDCSCGDGICDGSENPALCLADCFCGDGACSEGENSLVCESDCGSEPLNPVITGNYVEVEGIRFATLENMDPHSTSVTYLTFPFAAVPKGWVIAPNSSVAVSAISSYPWAAHFGITASGDLHQTFWPDSYFSPGSYANPLETSNVGPPYGYKSSVPDGVVMIMECEQGTFAASDFVCQICSGSSSDCGSGQVLCYRGAVTDGCSDCLVGEYKSGNECVQCPSGTYSGSAAASACDEVMLFVCLRFLCFWIRSEVHLCTWLCKCAT